MSIGWRFPKDPADVAPYTVDFRGIIAANDEIESATWEVDGFGVTVGVPYNQNRLTTAVLGGPNDDVGVFTFTITVNTVAGYTFQREVVLTVAEV